MANWHEKKTKKNRKSNSCLQYPDIHSTSRSTNNPKGTINNCMTQIMAYADDVLLSVRMKTAMSGALQEFEGVVRNIHLRINKEKTKYMKTTRNQGILLLLLLLLTAIGFLPGGSVQYTSTKKKTQTLYKKKKKKEKNNKINIQYNNKEQKR
jgi:hypothetical protein